MLSFPQYPLPLDQTAGQMKLTRTPGINECLARGCVVNESQLGDRWIEYKAALGLARATATPLADLLRGTSVYTEVEEPRTRPKTAEYVQLMENLRHKEAEKEYQKLVGRSTDDESVSIAQINKEINSHLTTIVNVLVSIFAIAWAFWYWCASWPLPARTLVSMFAGIFAGVAEIVVFAGYQRRLAQAQKQTVEERKVLKQVVFPGAGNAAKEAATHAVGEEPGVIKNREAGLTSVGVRLREKST